MSLMTTYLVSYEFDDFVFDLIVFFIFLSRCHKQFISVLAALYREHWAGGELQTIKPDQCSSVHRVDRAVAQDKDKISAGTVSNAVITVHVGAHVRETEHRAWNEK